ncbi:MAG TPA: hypothetical protein VF681_14565 [Abditibacteriaceae bacterium]|jgi:hypothetical protein
MIPLANICTVSPHSAGAVLSAQQSDAGWIVNPLDARSEVFLHATERCGDAPHKYHPAYVAAILSGTIEDLETARLPEIFFTTDEATRRSMTLNGMRMSIEFRQTGSRRVMELVENRLAAGQNDSVHDVLVYLMRLVWDARGEIDEAIALRSESLAAWLGLDALKVGEVWRLCDEPSVFIQALQRGDVGTPRRSDIAAIIENQWDLLQDDLAPLRRNEAQTLALIQEIKALLASTVDFDCTS